MWVHHQEIPKKMRGHQSSGAQAPELWCPFKLTTVFFIVISGMDIRNINLSFFSSVFMCPWHFLVISEYCQQKLRIHNQENTKKIVGAPEFWCPGTRTLVPFQVDNRFFVLISKMGFRNINLSFFPSVFMCSRHFLFLLEHCQHKWEYTIKKTPKKNGGAPKFWCPGTRTLVPPMFLTVYVFRLIVIIL